MNTLILALAAFAVPANFLTQVVAEFFVLFPRDPPKTIFRKIFAGDKPAKHEICIYNCHYYLPPINSSKTTVHCIRRRFKWKFPTYFIGMKFYYITTFYKAYRPLDSESVQYEFSDTSLDQLPKEIWIGGYTLDHFPRINRTEEMVEFYKENTKDWITIVADGDTQTNLINFLATPDLSWMGNPNLTGVYLKAFVPYVAQVIVDYDAYMIAGDRPHNNSEPLRKGPKWLNWKVLKPVKNVYNLYRKKASQLHGVWLWNPKIESRLQKMIPDLLGKMVDPCALGNVEEHFRDGLLIPNERFEGDPHNMLCSLYCRFIHAVVELNRERGWFGVLTSPFYYHRFGDGRCLDHVCYCFTKNSLFTEHANFPLRFDVNILTINRLELL